MYRDYFRAKVISKEVQTKEVKEKIGFFKYQIKYINVYILKTQINDTRFILNIPVEKNVYDQAKENDALSIHLKFDYEFSAFHFLKENSMLREINVDK